MLLQEPEVAGYPCGMLGNLDPAGFAALHQLIVRLGDGDAREGIRRASTLLAEARQDSAAEA